MSSWPNTDPSALFRASKTTLSLQLSLGVKEATKGQQLPDVLSHLLPAQTPGTVPPVRRPPRRTETTGQPPLQETSILTSRSKRRLPAFPALGQAVCAHSLTGAMARVPPSPVQGWRSGMPSYQGKRDPRHKEMCPKNWETRESVRKHRHTEPRAGTSGNT